MANLAPDQRRRRDQIETVIRLMTPALNLVLAAGERLSRIVEPDDPDYYPVRAPSPEPPPKPEARRPATNRMTREEQLEFESQYAPRVAVAAFASGILAVVGFALYVNTLGNSHDSADLLQQVHKHEFAAVLSALLTAFSVLLLIPVLMFLYRATVFRRPQIPRAALILAIAAPAVAAIVGIMTPILQIHAADQYVKEILPQYLAVDRANHFLRQGAAPIAAYAGIAASFGLAAALALISLNARRAGLLSGFMGVLGVILASSSPSRSSSGRRSSSSSGWARSACCCWTAGPVSAVPPGTPASRSRGPPRRSSGRGPRESNPRRSRKPSPSRQAPPSPPPRTRARRSASASSGTSHSSPSPAATFSLIASVTVGSRSVVTSPSSRPSARSFRSRRMILPERVFGRSSA